MDAAAKPPWMGLRRLPQPDPPRLPQEASFCFGCCCCSGLQQVQGAALPNHPHSATCSTCRGSGLVSGSCQKIIVEVRVIAPTHRNVACSAAVALWLSR